MATLMMNFNILENPLSFSEYIIPYLTVKKQHIYGKVYVKFVAGPFLNVKLTTIKDGR